MAGGRDVTIRILGDPSDFQKAVGQTASATSGMERRLNQFAGFVKGAIALKAADAVKDFVGDSVRAYSDLEQSIGGTEAVFGDSSDAIDAYAKKAAKAIGLSEAEFRTATTGIGGQLKRMTGDVDLAAEQAVKLTEIGADLAATYGGTTAEAVDALGSAFRGEADPAERFNLNLKISAVNAKAMEMGLADAEGAIDDSARAQATLALITEQSADAQGQFAREAESVAGQQQRLNAELENSKALFGQGIAGAVTGVMPLLTTAAKTIGILGIGFADLTGQISGAQAAVQEFQVHTGDSATSLASLITIQKQSGESFEDLFRTMDLATSAFAPLTDAEKAHLETLGYTKDEIQNLSELMAGEFRAATEDARDHGVDYLKEGIDDLGGGAEDTRTELEKLEEQLHGMNDPVWALQEAISASGTAQAEYNEAVEKFGANSPEAVAAAGDLTQANIDVRLEAQRVKDKMAEVGPAYITQWSNMQREMGISEETIKTVLDLLGDVEGFTIGDKTFNFIINGKKVTGSGGYGDDTTVGKKARGGSFKAGDMDVVGEEGPEVVKWGAPGTVIPNNALGGEIHVHLHAQNVFGPGGLQEAARVLRDELVKLERQGG